MKLTDKQRGYLRLMVWTGGLVWGLLFLSYGLLLMPAFLEVLDYFYGEGLPMWIVGVSYIFGIVTAVVIFFWFFSQMMKKTK